MAREALDSVRPPKRQRTSPSSSIPDQEARLSTSPFFAVLDSLMRDGAFSKAIRYLTSEGIHDPLDPTVLASLRDKYPPCSPPARPTADLPRPEWDDTPEGVDQRLKDLKHVIMSFPLASGAGPSGLRPQHLQDIFHHDKGPAGPMLQALDAFCKACLDGSLPPSASHFLCSASLIPLRKGADGSGVRPIAVGETLRRVVGKYACSLPAVRLAVDAMLPHQCGVMFPGACETVSMGLSAITSTFASNPHLAVLQVDCANAFNSIDRASMLRAVTDSIPTLSRWAWFSYGEHTPLFCGSSTISSQQGVQQGDPLGPLFFALTLQSLITRLPPSLRVNCWYLDDGHLVGTMDDLATATALLSSDGPSLGLHLNLSKCTLWGPAVPAPLPPTLAPMKVVPWAPGSGLTVLGLPVSFPGGDGAYASAHLNSLVDKLEHVCHLISSLGHPHYQHLLLRFCADACRIIHFLRGVQALPSFFHVIGRTSAAIRPCVEDTVGAGALADDRWAQCCLPLRSTGLGIKDPALLADCCRVSASLSFLSRAPALAFPPSVVSLPPDFLSTLLRLRNTIDPAFGPLPTWITADNSLAQPFPPPEPIHRSQQWWTKALYTRLAESMYASSTSRDKCRLRLQSQPFTSAWMLTVPHDGVPHSFPPSHYRALLRWWLGIPLYLGDSFHPCPMCGGPMDPFGDHLVSCKSNHLTERHHGVRDALTEVLRSMGVPCQKEVTLPSRPERPGDVSLTDFDPRGPILIDLCAIHPLAPSRDYHPDTVLTSLADKEKQKTNKYHALCARDAYFFSPSHSIFGAALARSALR